MNAEQAGAYIGTPYEAGATGPDSFNCWFFVSHVLLKYFGKKFPDVNIENAEEIKATHREYMADGRWTVVREPQHGDVASMREGINPHVGIYLDIDGGGILHAEAGIGVNFIPLRYLNQRGYGRTTYYRIA